MSRHMVSGILACVLLLGFGWETSGQDGDPRNVLDSFLRLNAQSKLMSPEARALLAGEAAVYWNEPSIGLIPGAPDRVIDIRPDYRAIRVTGKMPKGVERDFYFYLRRHDATWKIEAMRTLAATGVLDLLLEQLKDPNAPPDAADIRRNIELTLASDSVLRSWFTEHRSALVKLTTALPESEKSALCKTLGVGGVDRQGDSTTITIGGLIDNTVGFLFSPTRAAPGIDPSEFIWVEDLGEGWFLFRTT